ncbi:hypothetical protein G6F56_000455 [Rhizopus delemar]|nr:hypothetical protein G6F56_000455 [Rhizopus delemar]
MNPLGLECASFDSTRTDLSIGSKDVIIADQWIVLGRIGEGSFGEVFEAEDIDTGRKYAVKREPKKMRNPQIKHEHIIYDVLAGAAGIPQCHWYGQHDDFDCIVIDLLGPNVNQLKEFTTKLPMEVVIDFGCQMVTMMEHIHNRGLVYRDIKPDNFLFSADYFMPEPDMVETTDEHGMSAIKYRYPTCQEIFKKWQVVSPKLYLVDFGLTTWWRNPETKQPYPETKKDYRNKAGTARYASLHVHRGKPHARRDDIESIGYLLLDMIFGTLPWTGIQARNSRAGWDRMRQIKEDTFMSDICAGLPKGILEFIEYARKIKFLEEPNYELLRQFLKGSIEGAYSDLVVSPFGGHADKKWLKERNRKPSYQDQGVFQMDDLVQAVNDIKPNKRNSYHRRTSKDLGKPEKSRRRKKQVGWNSHKHDNEPWAPAIDWSVPTEKPEEAQWEKLDTWGNKSENWADTVNKPWD